MKQDYERKNTISAVVIGNFKTAFSVFDGTTNERESARR